MSKVSYDLDELLLQSQRLQAQTADSSKRLRRGVTELYESSKSLAEQYHHTQVGEKLGQRMLLSERKFDSDGLTHDINAMDFEPAMAATEKLESTDIEGYLAHHHDIIILGAVEDARRASEVDADAMERRWAASNWKSAREEFLQNLGHRSQGWTGATGNGRDSARKGAISDSVSRSFRGDRREDIDSARTPSAGRLLFSPQSSNKAPTDSAVKSAWSMIGASTTAPSAAALPRPLLEHASVIRRLNRTTFGTKQAGSNNVGHQQQLSSLRYRMSPASELLDCVQDCQDSFDSLASQGFSSVADLIGYKSCLQMLGDMATGGGYSTASAASNTAGFFSPLCLSEEDISRDSNSIIISNAVKERRRIMSCGSKTFFERQYEELLMESVTDHISQQGGLPSGVSSLFRSSNSSTHHLGTKVLGLQNFLELKRRAGAIPAVCMQSTISLQMNDGSSHPGTPLWPLIVVCLRIGDLEAASDILRLVLDNGSDNCGIEPEIIYALDGYIELGVAMLRSGIGHAVVDSESGDDALSNHEFRRRFQASVASCHDLFQSARQVVNGGQEGFSRSSGVPQSYSDPYRMDVLNFLSLSSVNDISDDVYGGSLEDYLWCNLWFVQWSRELLDAGVMNSAHGLVTRARDSPSYIPALFSESDLYQGIMEAGGEEYFDRDGSLPFKYATVLFACQCIGEGILHLWKIAKSFSAAHLSALALHYGMIFPHLPLAGTGNISSGSDLYGGNKGLSRATLSITAGEVLQRWTKMSFQCGHAEDAADYLLCLNMSKSWVNIQCNSKLKSALQVNCQELLERTLVDLISSSAPSDIRTLLGDVVAPSTGMCRGMGVLDDYFERNFVDLLLSRAAYTFITVHRNPEEALRLYYLGGRYVEVVEELCNQLSLNFVPPSGGHSSNAKRAYWIEASVEFFSSHLRIGATHDPRRLPVFELNTSNGESEKGSMIRKSIEQHGRLELLDTFCTLLNLSFFVNHVTEKRWEDAIRLLQSIGMFPTTENAVSGAVQRFKMRDGVIKAVADDSLIFAAESLRNLYAQQSQDMEINSQHRGNTVGVTASLAQKLHDIKIQAAALTAFATSAKDCLNRSDTPARVARLDVSVSS